MHGHVGEAWAWMARIGEIGSWMGYITRMGALEYRLWTAHMQGNFGGIHSWMGYVTCKCATGMRNRRWRACKATVEIFGYGWEHRMQRHYMGWGKLKHVGLT